jgi:hypothetical protein
MGTEIGAGLVPTMSLIIMVTGHYLVFSIVENAQLNIDS